MKKYLKVTAGILSAAVLSVAPLSTLAQELKAVPISAPVITVEEQTVNYMSFTGVVKEINPSRIEGVDWKYVLVESTDGQLANFVVSEDTVFLTETPLQVGANVTGYYDANLPMIMIYPMQPKAEVMAVEMSQQQYIKIDRFDSDLLSFDKDLKLNISPETNITLRNGETFSGELADHKLVVVYSFLSKSLPPQTSPIKVIVLDDSEVSQEEKPEQSTVIREIVVENKRIDAPAPFVADSGATMVPLRAIAETLGYKVEWDDATNSVTIGTEITVAIGRDTIQNKAGLVRLSSAPIIVEGRTFVPLAFFREVVPMNNAQVIEGRVIIDNSNRTN